MILMLRVIAVFVRSFFRPRAGVREKTTLTMRVWPNDLDFNLHMNNGRYLSFMDLGRFDYILRNGLVRVAAKNRWFPVVGSATIRFVKSLAPFEKFVLETELLAWDEKWFYIRHWFRGREGKVMAIGVVRGVFHGRDGVVAPARMLSLAGFDEPSPPIPQEILTWQEGESALVRQS